MPGMPECNSKQLAMQQMQIQKEIKIYSVYEKDDIKYKYDRKGKTEKMAEKHTFQV